MAKFPNTGRLAYALAPAAIVLQHLGVRPLARALNISPEAVSQWARPAERGGTGGFIPPRYHSAICYYAATVLKGSVVTPELLASKTGRAATQEDAEDMANRQRQKGDRFERRVAQKLTDLGLTARRMPLSGACVGFEGDVEYFPFGQRLLVQCKISGDGSGYGRIRNALEKTAVFQLEGADMVAVNWSYFARLSTGRAVAPANLPSIKLPLGTALKAIEGHHVLVFRKDRGEEAVVLTGPAFRWLIDRNNERN